MLSSRTSLTLGAALVSLATTGCPRSFDVHIDTAEMTRAKPLLARTVPWSAKDAELQLATTEGISLPLQRAGVLGWRGDDGSRLNGHELLRPLELSNAPGGDGAPFFPPRGGTWTLHVRDDTTLSSVGKYTTITGGSGVGLMGAVILFTGMIIGPEPSFDPEKVFKTEGLILIGPVSVATVGGILWAAGNLAFKLKPAHLGEGVFQFNDPPRAPGRPPSSGGYFGDF